MMVLEEIPSIFKPRIRSSDNNEMCDSTSWLKTVKCISMEPTLSFELRYIHFFLGTEANLANLTFRVTTGESLILAGTAVKGMLSSSEHKERTTKIQALEFSLL